MNEPIIKYFTIGKYQIKRKRYYNLHNKIHRDPLEGPAQIEYKNGELNLEIYYVKGKWHNPYGPAYFDHEHDVNQWHFNGDNYTIEVYNYLEQNSLDYKTMSRHDFDIMWISIL